MGDKQQMVQPASECCTRTHTHTQLACGLGVYVDVCATVKVTGG